MSLTSIGNEERLIALSKPDFVEKLDAYKARGFTMVPESLSVTGFIYKWRMELLGDLIDVEETPSESPTVEIVSEPQPVTATFSTTPTGDFLPDWEKVDKFLEDNPEKEAKVLLDSYAETFGVNLNRRSSFANMKAKFIEECNK